jgi:ABC-type nitrate/sulfonate/bicarbonate transport system permease component
LGIAAAVFCSCYYYLVGTSVLRLEGPEVRTFVARETTLQVLLFSLIAQFWLLYWKWFLFAATYQAPEGLGVFIVIVVLLMVIQWIFRFDFELVAEQHGSILYEDLKSPTLRWMGGFLLFTLAFTVIWERMGHIRFPHRSGSPLGAISAGYDFLAHREIYIDIQVSLLEMLGGIVLGGLIAIIVSAFMSANNFFRNATTPLLPLSNISPMVLWLLSFLIMGRIIPDFLNYWHKVLAVACVGFFPFIRTLWALRESAMPIRVLMATDQVLPYAFIAMLVGQLWAATAGLGFTMIVSFATYQLDKAFAVFIITVVLLTSISAVLRVIVKLVLGESRSTLTAPTT